MILHVAKSKAGKYLGMFRTLEEAKGAAGVHQVFKVDTDQVAKSQSDFISFLKLINLPFSTVLDGVISANLPLTVTLPLEEGKTGLEWQPDTDYGDGEYVIYEGRRVLAQGIGIKPGW